MKSRLPCSPSLARVLAPLAWALIAIACDRPPHAGDVYVAQDATPSSDAQGTDVQGADVAANDVAIDTQPVDLDVFAPDVFSADSVDAFVTETGADVLVADAADIPDVASGPMPDFTLPDVNPNSATYGTSISPRDHLGEVTAWYFGHST